MYVKIWKFKPRPGYETEFENAYGPHGVWTDLFSRVNGYLGTSLLKELDAERIYIVVDSWDSKEDYNSFMNRYRNEYQIIDDNFERINELEIKVGEFFTK